MIFPVSDSKSRSSEVGGGGVMGGGRGVPYLELAVFFERVIIS